MPSKGFLPQMSMTCPAITAPIGTADSVTNPAAALAPLTLVDLAAADPAYKGGTVTNDSCDLLEIEVGYLTGGDCIACNTDTISIETKTYTLKPGEIWELADAYWQDLTATRVDAAGDPVASGNGADSVVSFETEYVPSCPSCIAYAI